MLILVKDNPRKEKPQFGVMISSYKVKKKKRGGGETKKKESYPNLLAGNYPFR